MSPSRIASPARLLGLSPVKAPMMHSEGNPYLSAIDVHSDLISNGRVLDNDDSLFVFESLPFKGRLSNIP